MTLESLLVYISFPRAYVCLPHTQIGPNAKASDPEQIQEARHAVGPQVLPSGTRAGQPAGGDRVTFGWLRTAAERLDPILPPSRTSSFILRKTTTKLEDWTPLHIFHISFYHTLCFLWAVLVSGP